MNKSKLNLMFTVGRQFRFLSSNSIPKSRKLGKNNKTSKMKITSGLVTNRELKTLKKEFSKINLKNSLISSVPKLFISIIDNEINHIKLDYPVKEMTEQIMNYHDNLMKNTGVLEGTSKYSEVRLYVIQLLEGVDEPTHPKWVSTSRLWRWPTAFSKSLSLFRYYKENNCPKAERALRSLLYINKLAKGNSSIDLDSIVKVHEVPYSERVRFRNYVRKWVQKNSKSPLLRFRNLIAEPTERFVGHGPNSKPKLETADLEAFALYKSELFPYFSEYCKVTGNESVLTYLTSLASRHKSNTKVYLRKIVSIADSANKSRLVAISDYWTQLILRPLMIHVQNIIQMKFGKNSSSKDHSSGFDKLKKYIRPGVKSYDMTSWTDRFPASMQKILLEELYGSDLANAWHNLVVLCSWNVGTSKRTVKYGTGQGMGTAGSFDIATLTDLLILHMLYEEEYNIQVGVETFNKVGDDLWCFDPDNKIYSYYTEALGLDINLSKTKSSSEDRVLGEFVSRNINRGHDVSRISPNICRSVQSNLLELPSLCLHLEERGYTTPLNLNTVLNLGTKNFKNIVRTLFLQCHLFGTDKKGMNLLKRSLSQYSLFIQSDPICTALKLTEKEILRRSFYKFALSNLLLQIYRKLDQVLKTSIDEYECSIDMIEANSLSRSFDHCGEDIMLRTSKYMLARTHKSINILNGIQVPSAKPVITSDAMVTMVTASDLSNTPQASEKDLEFLYNQISSVYENITFKDLGVVYSEEKYRPVTTKLYNFVAKLRFNPDLCPSHIPLNEEGYVHYGLYTIKELPHLGTEYEKVISTHDLFPSIDGTVIPSVPSSSRGTSPTM